VVKTFWELEFNRISISKDKNDEIETYVVTQIKRYLEEEGIVLPDIQKKENVCYHEIISAILGRYGSKNQLIRGGDSHRTGNKSPQTLNDRPVSRWLPDAENAKSEQSIFEDFAKSTAFVSYASRNNEKWGIVSVKGAGKTYLLQVIRRNMSSDLSEFIVIPRYHVYSAENDWGIEALHFNNPENIMKSNYEQLRGLWKSAILCFVLINTLIVDTGKKLFNEDLLTDTASLHDMYYEILQIKDRRLSEIVNFIIEYPKWQPIVLDEYGNLRRLCEKALRIWKETENIPIVMFIDRIDQSVNIPSAEIVERYNQFENPEDIRHETVWQCLQMALVKAASELQTEFNNQIRAYYTIRQEAFHNEIAHRLWSDHAPKIRAINQLLYYSKREQERIYIGIIQNEHPDYLCFPKYRVNKGAHDYAFVGVSALPHPYITRNNVSVCETVFESIYRHSFDRAREIQYFGWAIKNQIETIKAQEEEDRAEIVKEIIDITAANLLLPAPENAESMESDYVYYKEKQPLLPSHWANKNNFISFIKMIDKNLLFLSDVQSICVRINEYTAEHVCDTESCRDCQRHPFSMLYQLGLLGYASCNRNKKQDDPQIFIDSKDVLYFDESMLLDADEYMVYIVHPSLTKCIERNHSKKALKHFNRFVLGKGLTAPKEIFIELLIDREAMNKGLMSNDDFDKKYYTKGTYRAT